MTTTRVDKLRTEPKFVVVGAGSEVERALPDKAARSVVQNFELGLTWLERLADLVTALSSIRLAIWAANLWGAAIGAESSVGRLGFAVLLVLMLDRDGAYRRGNSLLRVRETERILRVCAQLYFLGLLLKLVLGTMISLRLLHLGASLVCILLVAEKQLLYVGVRALHAKGFGVRNVIVIGAGYTGRRVFAAFARSPKVGLDPVALVDDDPSMAGQRIFEPGYRRSRSVPIRLGPVTTKMIEGLGAEMVVVAIPSLSREKFLSVVEQTTAAGATLAFVPNHHLPSDLWLDHFDIDGVFLASCGQPQPRSAYAVVKRFFDAIAGSLLLLGVSPLWFAVATLIRLDSKGPALFKQTRVGKNGKLFEMYKFRTMYTDTARYQHSPTDSEDPRITKVGKFLRRSSFDEFPQLVNVIRGEMSLVGPRPEMPFIVEQYTPLQNQRLRVIPGITGLWQISADRAFLIHESIECDLYYIRNKSFFMDIAILLHTFVFAMRGI